MKFIALHEVGHIIMGHSNFVNQKFGLQFSYATHAEQHFSDSMLCQAIEFIADKNAIASLSDYVLSINCKTLNRHLLSQATIDADRYMLRSLVMAACILCHLFYTESQSINTLSANYPHPALRSLWISMELERPLEERLILPIP